MLLAHPAVLKNLMERYEALALLQAGDGGPESRQEFDDVGYLLCVATGTSDVDAALVAARYRLPGARTEDDSLLGAQDAVL
ncbi:DUF5133 domain-containing protein [Streptomyces sp. SP18CS02]|uniref:DUF5133 domain-containing protein n=1 Tax=Streptomyces sp. SP18CS02 TaxID=3002531 RepID=UPI002E79089A|nr:DUF5133 domain-containing protein [Streptomyces sp. SP18CS02]MEE1754726.1 DUF5133 domain-containing protein [Streptomyces sp. SP18CS02]